MANFRGTLTGSEFGLSRNTFGHNPPSSVEFGRQAGVWKNQGSDLKSNSGEHRPKWSNLANMMTQSPKLVNQGPISHELGRRWPTFLPNVVRVPSLRTNWAMFWAYVRLRRILPDGWIPEQLLSNTRATLKCNLGFRWGSSRMHGATAARQASGTVSVSAIGGLSKAAGIITSARSNHRCESWMAKRIALACSQALPAKGSKMMPMNLARGTRSKTSGPNMQDQN